jgi:hypothetical protein
MTPDGCDQHAAKEVRGNRLLSGGEGAQNSQPGGEHV